MKIYTKKGDKGQTQLFSGEKIYKSNSRIEAYGTLDELNAHLGVLDSQLDQNLWVARSVRRVQNELFELGSFLANTNDQYEDLSLLVAKLEEEIDQMNKELNPLRQFILPTGNLAIASCHVCRCVCRRGERSIVNAMKKEENISVWSITYINRLSDWLFILARYIAKQQQIEEVAWTKSSEVRYNRPNQN